MKEEEIVLSNSESMDDLNKNQKKRLFDSPVLFGNQNEIIICHKGEEYRIKITRNGKLVMNK